jgi:hypothetical protein
MKSKIKMNMFLVVLVAIFSASGASAAGIGNNIVVLLAGEGLADPSGNQFTELGLVAPPGVLCFDIDLVDAKTGNVIGRGSDCLSDITPSDNGGMSLTATSFFHFHREAWLRCSRSFTVWKSTPTSSAQHLHSLKTV